MVVKVNLSDNSLQAFGKIYTISCNVRTLRNGLRFSNQVVTSLYSNKPYMPCMFPVGDWNITGVVWQKDVNGKDLFDFNTYGPCKILTDAWQWVHVWKLDRYGDYEYQTDEVVKDYCYWFHYGFSPTTLGCIRMWSPQDAIEFGRFAEDVLVSEKVISLKVS